jgi:hypothetical protein
LGRYNRGVKLTCIRSSKEAVLKNFRSLLMGALLMGGSGLARADVIYTLTFDLSNLNAGSTLTGSVDESGPLLPGDFGDINLSFSDPSAYSATSLTTVLSSDSGTFGNQLRFSEISFVDLSDDKTIHLTVDVAAQCSTGSGTPNGVPCDANGRWEDGDPPEFTGTYTVTAQIATVPEPAYGFALLGMGAIALAFKRRRVPIA